MPIDPPLSAKKRSASCVAKESIYNPPVHWSSQARNTSYELHGRVMEDAMPCHAMPYTSNRNNILARLCLSTQVHTWYWVLPMHHHGASISSLPYWNWRRVCRTIAADNLSRLAFGQYSTDVNIQYPKSICSHAQWIGDEGPVTADDCLYSYRSSSTCRLAMPHS